MLLGCHVGITGGVERAPPVAKQLGCDVMQIFSKNQMQWKAAPLPKASVDAFRRGVQENGLGPTLIHCSYLLNLASGDDALWEKSVQGLVVELERADALGIPYVTFHPGSPKDKGAAWGCARVAEGVSKALELDKAGRAMVLLETNAGQGAAVGRTFAELGDIMARVSVDKKRVGVCFDTCHVFVSGYPLHTEEGYLDTFDTFQNEVGLQHLKCFHLNDSLAEFDSKKDRHAAIGEGKLGLGPFRRLVNDARFRDLPGYLETPGGEESYAQEIRLLRSLVAQK
jgi:deoxyribonuclease-4